MDLHAPTDQHRPQDGPALRPWGQLSSREQLELRIEYGKYLDQLPPTCMIGLKQEYFRAWLQEQGIDYEPDRQDRG
ncbi:MAG: hypothetical protein H7842_04770 [Gammaproteobacteria bacterium SHHR-1]|uniref:hypothetical protein n=1 Tax=Magnetovirga frankeli TaxID=947516 RepID=UPI001292EC44|nr:hypothetical protein D5125_10130 [gamma proteobacterium SS-5]